MVKVREGADLYYMQLFMFFLGGEGEGEGKTKGIHPFCLLDGGKGRKSERRKCIYLCTFRW